jgi:hypothetical protein
MFVVVLTGAVGIALLAGALGSERSDESSAPAETAPAPPSAATTAARALAAAGTAAAQAAPPKQRRKADPFAPPSLVRSQTQPIPWGRSLLEFAHPALAILGIGTWIGYAFIKNKDLGVVGAALLLAAAIAGVSWYQSGRRAKPLPVNRRALAAHAGFAVAALVLALITLLL